MYPVTTMLMMSNYDPLCPECQDQRGLQYCPSCQYAYWSTDDLASNPDNVHFTGLTEEVARKDPEMKTAVQSADNY